MNIKSVLNQNPVITIVIVAAVAGGAVWMGVRSTLPPQPKGQVYFTADNGTTWFADKATTVTPYTKEGKEVVRAYVFQCKDGKPFVAYLTKQNPSALSGPNGGGPSSGGAFGMMAMEFRGPGESAWERYQKMSPASRAKLSPACADGSKAEEVGP